MCNYDHWLDAKREMKKLVPSDARSPEILEVRIKTMKY